MTTEPRPEAEDLQPGSTLPNFLKSYFERYPDGKATLVQTAKGWYVAGRDGRLLHVEDHGLADRIARRWAKEQGGIGRKAEEAPQEPAGATESGVAGEDGSEAGRWSVGLWKPSVNDEGPERGRPVRSVERLEPESSPTNDEGPGT